MKALRWGLIVVTVLAGLTGTWRLAGPRPDPVGGAVKQLHFLRAAIDDGADHESQGLFPEGYFFLNVLYGLTWVQVATIHPEREAEAVREARWSLDRLQSTDGTAPFEQRLDPPYGIFHAGWTNWLRGAIATLDDSALTEYTQSSTEISKAFDAAASPYLMAYPGQAWPVDSTVAIASLALHDRLTTPHFTQTRGRWLGLVQQRLDPSTGLMPHQAEPGPTGARATSQSIIQRFLPEIDREFARSQYQLFRDKFVTAFGPGVREYPKGQSGSGDVDSGPLVLGVSLSATVVSAGAARIQDDPLGDALLRVGEVLGAPLTGLKTKRYAFGALPVGDAFVAWSATATPTNGPTTPTPHPLTWWWRLPWLLLCWLPALLVAALLLIRKRHPRPREVGG
ncbi:hypothetical protein GCM10029976_027490 [Kribbella albertanoniae]|uniref:DUF2264 domain-containing protein n=1 Tax=Kribbella albertanoniae TaxID=1266829 RepID=A0A4R4P0W6_9ACTN|nr:hypothetical protein [Kribbella albertanoniae]TDC15154.1 hypothetical protein E1261_40865 [Kribbella albertanoniae]